MTDCVNPAQLTDLMVRPLGSILITRSDYYVVKCPERPDFVFGNYIALKKAPEHTDEVSWWKRARAEFIDCPLVNRTTVQWESYPVPLGSACKEETWWAELGCSESYTKDVVLHLENLHGMLSTDSICGRKVSTPEDWKELKSFLSTEFSGDDVTESFLDWRIDRWREIVEQGAGMWWASRCGEAMIANAGILWSEEQSIARLQSVVVRRDLRSKGVGRRLVAELLREMNHVSQISHVIAVAENVAPSMRLYAHLGFEQIGWQYTVARLNSEVDSW